MQNSQFERLLKLAQRTGDRLIVTDPSGKEPVVILPLAEYEGLLDYKSFRGGEEAQDHESGFIEDVSESAPFLGKVFGEEAPEDQGGGEVEGEFDPAALEEQVMAAMVMEEPEVVPVTPSSVNIPREEREEERQPIARRNAPKEAGEEQFYMEAV